MDGDDGAFNSGMSSKGFRKCSRVADVRSSTSLARPYHNRSVSSVYSEDLYPSSKESLQVEREQPKKKNMSQMTVTLLPTPALDRRHSQRIVNFTAQFGL